MEVYKGKLCPLCKTQIQAEDAVVVCPDCGVVHHGACWTENHGCANSGCARRADAAQQPRQAAEPVVCPRCGVVLAPHQEFCPNCGTRPGEIRGGNDRRSKGLPEPDGDKNGEKPKRKTGRILIALLLVAAIGIGLAAALFYSEERDRSDAATEQYLEDTQAFLDLMLDSGVNLEIISDTIQTYWYENIWEQKHGEDINEAVKAAVDAVASEIASAQSNHAQLKQLYRQIQTLPSSISGVNWRKMDDVRKAAVSLYEAYEAFYDFVMTPYGSYNIYEGKNGELTNNFVEAYQNLKRLLE